MRFLLGAESDTRSLVLSSWVLRLSALWIHCFFESPFATSR